jgi:hypothetical protein
MAPRTINPTVRAELTASVEGQRSVEILALHGRISTNRLPISSGACSTHHYVTASDNGIHPVL